MSATQEYVGNIRETVVSFWHGMSVTLSHMFRRPQTVQYPDRVDFPVKETLPSRYRGFLEVDASICTACQACERACPIACIAIEVEKDPANPKQRMMTRFDIDVAKCMYCGLCVEPCPTGAIRFTKEFEGSTADLADLHLRLVSAERRVWVEAAAAEAERKAEAKKAAKAKPPAATADPAGGPAAGPAPEPAAPATPTAAPDPEGKSEA